MLQGNFKLKRVEADRAIQYEQKMSRHINVIGHFNDTILRDKNDHLIQIFEVKGLNAMTASSLSLDIFKQRRNSFFKGLDADFALYSWTVRAKTAPLLASEFKQDFAQQLNKKYQENFKQKPLFQNTIYLALIIKPPKNPLKKTYDCLKNLSLKKLSHDKAKADQQDKLQKMAEKLSQASRTLLSVLEEYQIRALGVIDAVDGSYQLSEPLSLISQLVNVSFDDSPLSPRIPLIQTDYSSYLPQSRLFFNARSGTIEIRAFNQKADNKKFAAMLSLKIYADHSFAGMLDGLCRLPLEMVITQSFRFLASHASKKALKDQHKDFEQINDESVSQTQQLKESLDEVASGESGLGFHHLSILCTSASLERLNSGVAEIVSYFSSLDMVCVREDIACELSFWAQLPGNFAYIPRASKISTKNLAGFISFHNAPYGKAQGNFWGEAVTILETASGSPYYFNFHDREVGVCLCFGAMGSGKTTLLGFLLTQSLKFGGKRIFFDKDRGLEILVRALRGTYERLTPGISTGFNPCRLSDTPQNRTFLNQLFKKMLTAHNQPFDESDAETIAKVINSLYALPEENRKLQHLAPYFGMKQKGSLRQRFEQWHSEGSLAWAFDNENDSLNLEAEVLGFDIGSLLAHPEAKLPALMYLMHRVTQALEGNRGGIFIDEGWQALDDDYFKDIINDFARTPRKKNNFICFATQSTEDTVKSAISTALNEAASAKFFFPNPAAKKETYMHHFGLKAHEVDLIQKMDNRGHYVLLGQGKASVIVRANLECLDDEIAVISGRESTVKLLDRIRQKVGDKPKDWMPIFLAWYKRAEQYV